MSYFHPVEDELSWGWNCKGFNVHFQKDIIDILSWAHAIIYIKRKTKNTFWLKATNFKEITKAI